jgi:hypothetical protein
MYRRDPLAPLSFRNLARLNPIFRACYPTTQPFGFLDRVCDRQSNAVAITDKTTVRVREVYYRNNVETSPTPWSVTTDHCAANVAIAPLYSHPAFRFLMSLPDEPGVLAPLR